MPSRIEAVSILGATGSIGASSLDVISRHPQRFRVAALTAGTDVDKLVELCSVWQPDLAVVADTQRFADLRDGLRARRLATRAAAGIEGLREAASLPEVDTVVAAIVGAAGLTPTLAAARAGKRLLLANKESIVCAGALLTDAVRAGGGLLIPLDSEHSAIAQCLVGTEAQSRGVRRLVLTASGGPFRTRANLSAVTPAEAVTHPNWVMGRKISVDSATLMNKGLEVIEASWLFGFDAARIDVVVHPQSVIHSMVEFDDGSVVAQLGTPDMRTPIAYGLGFPQRIDSGSSPLDFLNLGALTFEAPDRVRFPCLNLAYDALRTAGAAPAALNAANEVAVQAFLEERLPFEAIADVIADALSRTERVNPTTIESVFAIDHAARERAKVAVERFGRIVVAY